MNINTYIARPGFHDNPIAESALVEAARNSTSFQVLDVATPSGDKRTEIVLNGDPKAKLFVSAGLVVAQHTTKALAKAMFELAAELGANVYSARMRRYHSVSDWERRTRKHLRQQQGHLGRHMGKRLWMALAVVLIITLALWGGLGRGLAD